MMNQLENYYSHLNRYSVIGNAYRNYFLYPKFNKVLHGNILDVGCGLGHYLEFRSDVKGVDINPKVVAACIARGLDVSVMPLDLLPFNDISFDAVLLDNVLEHIAQPASLISEIKRILKPGGLCLIGVPGIKGMTHDSDHKVAYDEDSLTFLANSAGFSIREFFYMPLFKSQWLSKALRQYCIYSVFLKK